MWQIHKMTKKMKISSSSPEVVSDSAAIKLTDLIKLAGVELGEFKIHCATVDATDPLDEFFAGTFEKWQSVQTYKNFNKPHVLSLIALEVKHHWLFAGLYRVLSVSERKRKKQAEFEYCTEEVADLSHLTGRAVVYFEKTFRASYLVGEKHADKLRVSEIRPTRMSIGAFPGFNGVRLSFQNLKTIIREANPSWKGALANVAGVYVIADTTDGRLYVGSATGDDGLWQRWSDYAKNGHGGNRELRELLREKGLDHAKFLQWSLLEMCDARSERQAILDRETHWKKVLLSRKHGLNRN